MSNQEALDKYLKVDYKVFHNLMILKESLESGNLSPQDKTYYTLQYGVQIRGYKLRQEDIKRNTKEQKWGFEKTYSWLVDKWTNMRGSAIGNPLIIPVAIIAAAALSGTVIATTYLSNRQHAEAQLQQTDKMLKAIATSDPEVAKAIASRLNQTSTTSSSGGIITKVAVAALALVGIGVASKFVK